MNDHLHNNEAVIDRLSEVWASVVDACRGLDDGQWSTDTDCPGWTVRDQVSHLIGVERMLSGDPAPESLAEVPAHVKNAFGEVNEAWIEPRRSTPGTEVLDEFVDITRRRLDALRSMSTSDFDIVGWSPTGEVPYRHFMEMRVLDSWAHEQDIRQALGCPGGRNGSGEEVALDRCGQAMPYVVGKKAGAVDGSSVLFVVTGPMGRRIPVVVAKGRAALAQDALIAPTTTLTMDQTWFWRLGFGRVAPVDALDSGEVVIEGDSAFGRRVLESLSIMM
jgi:uncharacterized protein (TIGR03083 family)